MEVAQRFRRLADCQQISMTVYPFRLDCNGEQYTALMEAASPVASMRIQESFSVDQVTAQELLQTAHGAAIFIRELLESVAKKMQCDWLAYYESNLWC